MKIFLRSLVIATIAILSLTSFNQEPAYAHIKMDKRIEVYVKQLDYLYRKNNIDINWYKIKRVEMVCDRYFLGQYDYNTKVIYINTCNEAATEDGIYSKMMILIMAHEIGHSQGKEHVNDSTSIMYVNNGYIRKLLETERLSDLLLTPYKEKVVSLSDEG